MLTRWKLTRGFFKKCTSGFFKIKFALWLLVPVYRASRKCMYSEHHLFLIRLNAETGSSDQPWAFLPTLLFFFYSVQPTGTKRCKCCFYFFTGFVEIVKGGGVFY